jgi:uncharacterized protein YxjI
MFRRRARRDEAPEGAPAGSRYLLREKLLSIGDDFWIENDHDERIFKVDDKVLRVRDTVVIRDARGKELFKIQKRLLRARDTMAIERDGDKVATVKKAFVTPLRDRFTVDLESGGRLEVEGNILDHEYQITRDGIPVANISKRWFRSATATAWPSSLARTTPSSWPSPSASTTSPGTTASAGRRGRRRGRPRRRPWPRFRPRGPSR